MNCHHFVYLLLLFMSLWCTLVTDGFTSIKDSNSAQSHDDYAQPVLYRQIEIPQPLLAKKGFTGDVRVGDLNGNGELDFLVFRSTDNGMKPCFIGAFTINGRVLWQDGKNGEQPARPGPAAVYDFDGDGADEVLCFFIDPSIKAPVQSMANVVVQMRDGKTGRVIKQTAPQEMRQCSGKGPNWVHQRLLIANLRGKARPCDFIVKLGSELLAFNDELEVMWTYHIQWNEYSRCTAYIPTVGDIDSDGRDEINGGYYLLDDDGKPLWEKQIARHMDSVVITEWDNGQKRAICSGFGHVLDTEGNVILRLGKELVPHGQEVRVADFIGKNEGPEMVIRYNGHTPKVMLVDNEGKVLKRFKINESPNNTGMEAVWWHGREKPALLYNGGVLWHGDGYKFAGLPGLPEPKGDPKMGWYHCIPGNLCGDTREDIMLYNPWDKYVWIFTPAPFNSGSFSSYKPSSRQYNVRLMD